MGNETFYGDGLSRIYGITNVKGGGGGGWTLRPRARSCVVQSRGFRFLGVTSLMLAEYFILLLFSILSGGRISKDLETYAFESIS